MKNHHKPGKNSLRGRIVRYRASYVLTAPFAIIFLIFTVIPVFISIYFSFTDYNILQPPKFVFWENYRRLFFADDIFGLAIQNTLIFAVITGPVSYFLCFIVAWFINDLPPKLRAFMTLLFYAPALSGVTAIWQLIFSGDQYGYLNSWLMNFGMINSPVQWFTDTSTIKVVVIIVVLWSSLGVSFLSFIAGLQNVDRSLFEAGAVDGIKNRYQELWYITLPSMSGQLLFSAVMAITSSFNIGPIITTLCGFPSSNYAAHTIMHHLTDYGSIRYEMGYACAIATILFLFMVGANIAVQKMLSKVGK
ncbi:MAG: sugar ABC transporter permease [Clostridia bacterium]|nr:sugar ABC transporter permease [Clostridia bacterium]